MEIAWKPAMSTGVPELDVQHQELIAAVNTLNHDMLAGKGAQEVEGMLTFVAQYAQSHFQLEERYFEKYACPTLEQNRAEHTRFLARFAELMDAFHRHDSSFGLMMKIHGELSSWLVQHILGVDIQLKQYVKLT